MSRTTMAAIASAENTARLAHDAYVAACHGVADAVAARVGERLQQIQRRNPRAVVSFCSGMGEWVLFVQRRPDRGVLGEWQVEDAAIDAVMQGALDAFGWDAVPTGDLKVVGGEIVGELS